MCVFQFMLVCIHMWEYACPSLLIMCVLFFSHPWPCSTSKPRPYQAPSSSSKPFSVSPLTVVYRRRQARTHPRPSRRDSLPNDILRGSRRLRQSLRRCASNRPEVSAFISQLMARISRLILEIRWLIETFAEAESVFFSDPGFLFWWRTNRIQFLFNKDLFLKIKGSRILQN